MKRIFSYVLDFLRGLCVLCGSMFFIKTMVSYFAYKRYYQAGFCALFF